MTVHFVIYNLKLESHHRSGRRETQEETAGRTAKKEGRTRRGASLSTGTRRDAETV